jgi:hypothetical protein
MENKNFSELLLNTPLFFKFEVLRILFNTFPLINTLY